jgi:hypothetical protein
MRTELEIQKQLHEYKKRKEKYKEIIKKCNYRICNLNKSLKLKKKHKTKFKLIKEKVIEFYGEFPKDVFNRDLVIKFMLEDGVKAELVAKEFKYKRNKTVFNRRKKVLNHLKINENKEKWEDLKLFMKKYLN